MNIACLKKATAKPTHIAAVIIVMLLSVNTLEFLPIAHAQLLPPEDDVPYIFPEAGGGEPSEPGDYVSLPPGASSFIAPGENFLEEGLIKGRERRLDEAGNNGNDIVGVISRPNSSAPNAPLSDEEAEEGEIKTGGVDKSDVVLQPPGHTVQESPQYVSSINSGLTSAATQLAATIAMVEPLLGNTVMQVSQDAKLHTGNIYSSQNAFIQSTEQNPLTREVMLRAYSGCIQKRTGSDGVWEDSAVSCLGGGGEEPFSMVDDPASAVRADVPADDVPEGKIRLSQKLFNPALNVAAEAGDSERLEKLGTLKKLFIQYAGDAEFELVLDDEGKRQTKVTRIKQEINIYKLVNQRTQKNYGLLGGLLSQRCNHNLSAHGTTDVALTDDYNPFDKERRDFWSVDKLKRQFAMLSTAGFEFDTFKGQLLYALAEADTQLWWTNNAGNPQMNCSHLFSEALGVFDPAKTAQYEKFNQDRIRDYKKFSNLLALSQVLSEYRALAHYILHDVVVFDSGVMTEGDQQRALRMVLEAAGAPHLNAAIESIAESLVTFFTQLSKREASKSGQLSGAASKASRQQGGIKDPLGGN